MKLILFDIDSTLVRVARPVLDRLTNVLARTIGLDRDLSGYELHGKTDRQIFREICGLDGDAAGDVAERCDRMERILLDHWREELDRDSLELLPGVVPLLDELAGRDDVALGVLTGNVEDGARMKLAPYGLDAYFPFGAFGSDSERRIDLPPIALERARHHHGRSFSFGATLIVGDSNRDIECARAWGIGALAVATGSLDADELRRHGPDAVVETLADRTFIDTFLSR